MPLTYVHLKLLLKKEVLLVGQLSKGLLQWASGLLRGLLQLLLKRLVRR
jgi:hypothetical protein